MYMEKKKWLKRICLVIGIILLNVAVLFTVAYLNQPLEIENISFVSFDAEAQTYTISVTKKPNFFDFEKEEFTCLATMENEQISSLSNNQECILTLPIETNYQISLESNGKTSSQYHLLDYINNTLEFSFDYDTMYLYVGETDNILYQETVIIPDEAYYDFSSSDENILTIANDTMTGISEGTVTITSPQIEDVLTVVVTNLIEEPVYQEEYKENLPCNNYSLDEANLLDEILAYKIERAGYQTRSGALEAARFLTLYFPYRIPYFYENGRLHSSGVHYVDGEGRYYKVGMYLHESKMASVSPTYSGPAIWGCPLMNWENDYEFGYYRGTLMPNGLDCSGFLSWALLNAGYDPGDLGAGQTDYAFQLPDLGEYVLLTTELIDNGTVKAGDFVSVFGHIGMIIGIDGKDVYVAESLADYGGVVNRKYSKYTINQTFDHVVLMDSYYKTDGNYTIMW